MANYQTINLPSGMLVEQANARISYLLEQLQSLQIQSSAELVQQATTIYQDFFENLGKPLVNSLAFNGIPYAQDWNAYQRRATQDLSILYNQASVISNQTDYASNFGSVENEMLLSAANNLKNQIASFQATKPVGLGHQRWVAADDFYDTTKIDMSNTTALITTGSVELARVSSINYSDQIIVTVDDEYVQSVASQNQLLQNMVGLTGVSNGFVGTTHEVIVNENTNTASSALQNSAIQLNTKPGDSISFVGDYGLHADISDVLDANPNTWFEYEVCNFPDVYKSHICNNYGFNYTLGNADGTTSDIPWYKFHGAAQSDPGVTTALFPPPPTTGQDGPYTSVVTSDANYASSVNSTVDPMSGLTTTILSASGSSVNFSESGASRTGDVLRLAINAALNSDKNMTQVSILPNVFNGCLPTIASIAVKGSTDNTWTYATQARNEADIQQFIDISGSLPSLTSSVTDDVLEVWVFPEQLVKYIKIIIEQHKSYDTNIGHIVWTEQPSGISILNTDSPDVYNNLFGGSVRTDHTIPVNVSDPERVEGPEISMENLISQSSAGSIQSGPQAAGALGEVVGLIAGIGSYLSGSPSNTGIQNIPGTNALSGPFVEYFPGWRYAIGIRDISFGIYSYATTSIVTSSDYSVPIDIKKVSLQVHEYIPNTSASSSFTANNEWISYQISIDGGSTWNNIAPASHYYSQSPKIYSINPAHGKSSVPSGVGSLQSKDGDAVNKIRLRATIQRPGDVDSLSPKLYRYQLVLEGDSI